MRRRAWYYVDNDVFLDGTMCKMVYGNMHVTALEREEIGCNSLLTLEAELMKMQRILAEPVENPTPTNSFFGFIRYLGDIAPRNFHPLLQKNLAAAAS